MCLTIPKKVISVSENLVTVENPDRTRQELKTVIGLEAGDYVISQQNVIIEKINKEEADDILKMIFNIRGGKEE